MTSKDQEIKSRSEKKREAEAAQELGKELLSLPKEIIRSLQLPEKLLTAVMDAKKIHHHEAQRRQMQYIGALMRTIDHTLIKDAVDTAGLKRAEEALKFKQLEDLRDGLISGEKDLQKEVLETYPNADRQHLSQLIRNARKEKEKNRPPKSSRALFRELRDLSSSS